MWDQKLAVVPSGTGNGSFLTGNSGFAGLPLGKSGGVKRALSLRTRNPSLEADNLNLKKLGESQERCPSAKAG